MYQLLVIKLLLCGESQLFVKYNIHFAGLSKSILKTMDNHKEGSDFADLVSQIGSLSFDSTRLHWR